MPRNCAEFHIIGQIGSIEPHEKVTFVKVASNSNRKVGDEWKEYTRWNRVTCFGEKAEKAQNAGVGDMVRITGDVEESSYERGDEKIYSTDLIAGTFSVLKRAGRQGGNNEAD